MLKPVSVVAVFAVPVVALSACSAPEQVATSPGTTPSVWTGSPSPSASPTEGHGQTGENQAASGEKLTAQLKLADGTTVFFSDAPGEHEAADEVGKLLEAPVQPRVPELTEQPPGVVVAVTG